LERRNKRNIIKLIYEKISVKASNLIDRLTQGMEANLSTTHIMELVIDSIATLSKSMPGIHAGTSIHISVKGIRIVVSSDRYKFVKINTVELCPK
jgi:hypothetical protein